MLFSKSSPSAPRAMVIGRIAIKPAAAATTLNPIEVYIMREKVWQAFSRLPSPMVFAVKAPPPVPKRKPKLPSMDISGKIKFNAVNSAFPAKLETKNPSTMVYTDVKISITMEGRVKRRSFAKVKLSENRIID